jgi:hypothetical protein
VILSVEIALHFYGIIHHYGAVKSFILISHSGISSL